ncbi:ribbon-helix-helix protein, CopG family [Acidianus sulfidivorans JP7]|uniref:Ribbon-helix-helix protein CopG domain-containing protein n=1 Tax=Acidianus sulfidivorans JP7 TaxID=619593 RepID=A0A2U9IK80_9CREN|nr:ribbon-helix-helix domain-containing protein [Acidianus sulfidivorans]AWR96420.1 ribbon-helix-helix protein, CopG family [Acidianus sulfidivorans JP7]
MNVNVYIPDPTYVLLERLAKSRNKSVEETILDAIEFYLSYSEYR